MRNIHNRHFKIRSTIKNKGFLKLLILSLLLIFILCSCSKIDGNNIEDVEAVNTDDNISEDITNQNLEEALTKVKDEVNSLAGRADVETSELFSIENTHYIKVKIQDLMLHYEYIYEGSVEDKPTAFTAYTDRDLNNIEKEISGVYYEIWRCEKGDYKRILYNMEDVLYSRDDDKIIIDGAYNSYIIKLGSGKDEKEKILYECYYTDILNSDKGDYTCYINNFFSVCVVDNKNNEIILNKYIDLWNEFSNEDFILDNNRVLFPTRIYINDKGWIKDSNMAYFFNHDLSYVFFVIDIDNRIVSQPNFTRGGGYESYVDKDKGYIVSGDTFYALDTDTYMVEHLKKQYNYLYLINLYTSEKFEIAKTIRTKFEFNIEDENTISYIASSGERVSVDISDMIGKERSHIRDGFKDSLHSQLNLNEDDNINIHIFNDTVYALAGDGENKMLIQYNKDKKANIIADKLNDINFSEFNKYISLYSKNGNIVVLDKNGNKYFEDNVFNYISNNDTAIELGATVWGKNNDSLYILTKKDDRLSNIFEINMTDKSIRDLAKDIDCRYENLYIDVSEGYVVYSTFPGPVFYYYEKEVNEDVVLYVKYFTGEKAEIARVKGESINFYIFNNKLEYYCRENDDVEGTYNLVGDIAANLLQEQEDIPQEQQFLLNGISLTKDIIRSVYRDNKGEKNYTYEVLLFSLAVNDDENNLYKGYFPFDENKGAFIFPLDKSNEVLAQVFGEREYSFKEDLNHDEESDVYYKNLDSGWNTAYRAENVTADISDDKSKLYTQFELINQWYDVDGDPVPTAVAECQITYSIIAGTEKSYLQFENMEIVKKLK